MPLLFPSIFSVMSGALASEAIAGISSTQLATGLANGLSLYNVNGLKVATVDTGSLGIGKGIGTVFLESSILISNINAAFAASGINGIFGPQLASAIGIALSTCISTAVVNTTHPVVGLGVSTGFIIPSGGAGYFIAGFQGAQITGPNSISMAAAIGNALDSALPLARMVIGIVGPPSIIPSSGAGFGVLI